MHVTVIGTGFVGLVAGACLADFGVMVTCADVDVAKVKELQAGRVPIYEPGLEEIIRRNVAAKRLSFSSDMETAIRDSLVLFVTVGTEPRPDGSANLDHVQSVTEEIGRHMHEYKVIVLKSTVPVGTAKAAAGWIQSKQKAPVAFDVVSNPEFLREGAAVEDFMRPNRVVLGSDSPRALAIVKDIYRPLYLIETPFVVTDNATAELIKYANNAFLAMKISYINEIARLCDRIGSDVHVVAKALGLDGRIGRKFLHPGPGFGGSCLPKDTRAFVHTFKQFGLKNQIVQAAIDVNAGQPKEMMAKLQRALGKLSGRNICLLGLAYKPNTNDVRESPAINLAEILLRSGAKLKAYDPVAIQAAKAVLRHRQLLFVEDPYLAAEGADAVVIATEWNEFRNLDLERLKSVMTGDVLLDCRNVYEGETVAKMGFRYLGVGRAAVAAQVPAAPKAGRKTRGATAHA